MKTARSDDSARLLEQIRKSVRRGQKRAQLAEQGAQFARRLADAFSALADQQTRADGEARPDTHHQPDIK